MTSIDPLDDHLDGKYKTPTPKATPPAKSDKKTTTKTKYGLWQSQ